MRDSRSASVQVDYRNDFGFSVRPYAKEQGMTRIRNTARIGGAVVLSLIALGGALPVSAQAGRNTAGKQDMAVGAQYDTAHVYVAPDQIDAFIASFIATFGGHATTPTEANVLPVPSKTRFQA